MKYFLASLSFLLLSAISFFLINKKEVETKYYPIDKIVIKEKTTIDTIKIYVKGDTVRSTNTIIKNVCDSTNIESSTVYVFSDSIITDTLKVNYKYPDDVFVFNRNYIYKKITKEKIITNNTTKYRDYYFGMFLGSGGGSSFGISTGIFGTYKKLYVSPNLIFSKKEQLIIFNIGYNLF